MESFGQEEAMKVLAQSLEDLKSLEQSTDWDVFSHSKQTESMRKPSGNLYLLRGICEVPLDHETIRDFIINPLNKPKWDSVITDVKELERYSDDFAIIYNYIKTGPGISPREAVYVQGVFMDDDENIFIPSRSIDYPSLPVGIGCIRVNIFMAGYIIRPIGPRLSQLQFISKVDPCGTIPTMLTNIIQKTQTRVPALIRDLLKNGER